MAWKMFPWDSAATHPSFTVHPLVHALGSALSGVSGAVDKTNLFQQLQGKKAPAATAIPQRDASMKLLSGLGITGEDANTILSNINRSSQISKLPQPLQQPVTDYFTAQQQKSQQQPFVDPMTMQMFFANTIAPYMQQFSENNSKQLGGLYDSELSNLPKNLDPGIRQMFQSIIPQEKTAALAQSDSSAQSLGPASAIEALMQQLANSQQTQLQYSANIRNNLAQNALGSLLGGSSPFAAPATPTTKTG